MFDDFFANIPIIASPDMPEDEVRLTDATGTVLARITNIGKPQDDCLSAQCAAGEHNSCADTNANCCDCNCHLGLKAIEPTSIDRVTVAYRYGINHETAKPFVEPIAFGDYYTASPLMRRLGYTANPVTCIHHRKTMYAGMTRFKCKDCGELL